MGLLRRSRGETAPFREEEAYERLHGERGGDIVRVITIEKAREETHDRDLTGEHLRRAFETKLDRRD